MNALSRLTMFVVGAAVSVLLLGCDAANLPGDSNAPRADQSVPADRSIEPDESDETVVPDGQGPDTLPADGAEKSAGEPPKPAWEKPIAAWKAKDAHESADNSFCYVCHLNYEQEDLTKVHQPVGVGCELCHGISDEHSADEDGITPPEIMYPKSQIDPFCMACHPKCELMQEDNHEAFFSEEALADECCTDCHAEKHHLEVRTRKWNKHSGELIWDDGVRMMEEKPAGGNVR